MEKDVGSDKTVEINARVGGRLCGGCCCCWSPLFLAAMLEDLGCGHTLLKEAWVGNMERYGAGSE
jgi:hypothetical protein